MDEYQESGYEDDYEDITLDPMFETRWGWSCDLRDLMNEYGTFSDEAEEYIEDRAWDAEFLQEARFTQILRDALLVSRERRSKPRTLANWLLTFLGGG